MEVYEIKSTTSSLFGSKSKVKAEGGGRLLQAVKSVTVPGKCSNISGGDWTVFPNSNLQIKMGLHSVMTVTWTQQQHPGRAGSVTARIGFSVDPDLHVKLLHRIGSRWCKNHEELDLCVCASVHFFLFSTQNEFVVRLRTLCSILHDETVI